MTLYILQFNNYFNRIVRKESTLDGYLDSYDYVTVTNFNFNSNDGVNATVVANVEWVGDYLVVADGTTIRSRWFITESKWQRNGQYTLTLRRDLLVDYYDNYVGQPCYIEKATLPPDDPMIFNSEGMQFNIIKKSEQFICQEGSYDKGWIVGYTQIPTASTLTDVVYDYKGNTTYEQIASLESWDFYDYVTLSSTSTATTKKWHANATLWLGGATLSTRARFTNGESTFARTFADMAFLNNWRVTTNEQKAMTNTSGFAKLDSTKNLFATWKDINNGEYDSNDLIELDGKIIKDQTSGKFYKIHIKYQSTKNDKGYVNSTAGTLQANLYSNLVSDWGNPTGSGDTNHNQTMAYYEKYDPAYLYLEETAIVEGDLALKSSEMVTFFAKEHKLQDADYIMFCIPCPPFGSSCTCNELAFATYTGEYNYEKSMAIAQMLVSILQPSSSGGNLIDLQLLPYCPIQNSDDLLDTLLVRDSLTSDAYIGEVFCARSSNFTFNDTDSSITIGNPKISNECDKYRLVSPNYASSFEFSPAKNGNVPYFHVNCTYKPYQPYINVHPYFQNLYGQDFDDNRGLVLVGDFSLPMTNDTFADYQIQNKNYSNIFDRQMQNIDKQNAWSMANSVTGAVAGTVQGAAMGAMAGPYGAIAGGIASGIGGAMDVAQSATMMKENKDLQRDMYSYQLGNIDSKPNSLVKNSAFDISFKMWPYVEYATCTDVEREAFENKIYYNGMTVNRIGTISEFLDNSYFIKGQLIRLGDVAEDSHIANEIYLELEKGAYFE